MTVTEYHQMTAPTLSEPPTLSIAELDNDPHGIYRQYRPQTPFIRSENGLYFAIRADDVASLTTDPRIRKPESDFMKLRGIASGSMFDLSRNSMLTSNGEEHRRRRAPLSRPFAVRTIAALRPRIRAVADELIDKCHAKGEMNFIEDYSALIPARTISDILGIPEADIPSFTAWVYSFARTFSASFQDTEVPEIQDAGNKLVDYVASLLRERRASPTDDLLTEYTKAADEAGDLSPEEIVSQIVTVILAGSDTTRAAMAMQVALLLQHREQWDAVCQDNGLVPGAVLEGLRYEPSVGAFGRVTLEDIEIDGVTVPAHSVLALATMSAMRDPAAYAEPDTFNIRRTDHPRWHAVFAGGEHRCLGEALAKAELEEGLAALAARLPHLELLGEPPQMLGHGGIRQISPMHVVWRA
jgi:cytochrome P450